jgi:hypothetical protein
MNYNALVFSLYELQIMTLDPIKLPSYNTFPYFRQSKRLKLTVNGHMTYMCHLHVSC